MTRAENRDECARNAIEKHQLCPDVIKVRQNRPVGKLLRLETADALRLPTARVLMRVLLGVQNENSG